MRCHKTADRLAFSILLIWVAAGACSYRYYPLVPHTAEKIPQEVQERYEFDREDLHLYRNELREAQKYRVLECHFFNRTRTGEKIKAEFHYYRSKKARSPLLVVLPILEGNYLAESLAARIFAGRGYSTIYLKRHIKDPLDPRRALDELEANFVSHVSAARKAVFLLIQSGEVDPERISSFGISLGGIESLVLLAVEPRIKAGVVVFAGAGLDGIFLRSREGAVARYREGLRQAHGWTEHQLAEQINRRLESDPKNFIKYLAPERVLLFLARYDDKVPLRYGQELRKRLGCETIMVPTGHYTLALHPPALLKVIRASARFFKRTFSAGAL